MKLTDEQLNNFFMNALAKDDDRLWFAYIIFKLGSRVSELEAELAELKTTKES